MDAFHLINTLREQTRTLSYFDNAAADALQRRTEIIIRRLLGDESQYLQDLSKISFMPNGDDFDGDEVREAWKDGRSELLNLLDTVEVELTLSGVSVPGEVKFGRQIFVVHGHDEAMKQSVARSLETLGFEPTVLHEKPNQGRTIIEKFSDYSDVGFAVVLLSPDDIGRARANVPGTERPRARQNVILELGYFLGKLGRDRVMALFKPEQDFEMPSDYSGVLFIPFDDAGKWKFDVAKELRACGYEVDANRLLS